MRYKLEPWDHQRTAVNRALENRDFAFLFEMGCGKTGATINTLRFRFLETMTVRKTLIIGPLITLTNWKREFALHSNVKQSSILVLNSGPAKSKLKKFVDFVEKDGQLVQEKIVLLNYEAFQNEDLLKALELWAPEIIIADESHRIKNHKSKRAKAIIRVADKAKHRYILTGTPILNSPKDIFNQYRFLDGGDTFGKNFYAFQCMYFKDENATWSHKPGYFPKFVPKPERFGELTRKIYTKAMRVTKDECLDLPPLIRKTIEVPLGKDQAKLYKEMKNDFITFVEDQTNSGQSVAVVAQLAITKGLRLQQITSGYVKSEAGEEIQIKENPRLEILRDLLGELHTEHKVIVWASFINNYRAIEKVCNELGLRYCKIVGGMSDNERQLGMEQFQRDNSVRVCIANRGAGGEGINLTAADYSIVYSRNFSLKEELQSEARNHRGGSEIHEKIVKIDLVSPGTIDELVLDALRKKEEVSNLILDWKEKV